MSAAVQAAALRAKISGLMVEDRRNDATLRTITSITSSWVGGATLSLSVG
jgi:hypothetical protein